MEKVWKSAKKCHKEPKSAKKGKNCEKVLKSVNMQKVQKMGKVA